VERRQFEALELVSESLTDSCDPQLLNTAADFFVDNAHFDRAVNLLALAKRVRLQLRLLLLYTSVCVPPGSPVT